MGDTPIRVEVVTDMTAGDLYDCIRRGVGTGAIPDAKSIELPVRLVGTAPKGSLTEAMMQLAEARMALHDYRRSKQNRHMSRTKLSELYAAEDAALARVRKIRGEG